MTFTPELVLSLLGSIAAGFGAYTAIRADLARLHERTSQLKTDIERAHSRIDDRLHSLRKGPQ